MNESRVIYEHNTPFSNLTVWDTVSLEARADFALHRLDVTPRVRISVAGGHGGLERLASPREPLVVKEGGSATLSTRNLNTSGILNFIREHRSYGTAAGDRGGDAVSSSLRLRVTALPRHGVLTIR